MVLVSKARSRWLQILTHIGALFPLVLLVWNYTQNLFIVDPIKEITVRTGRTALVLLLLSLSCTPINTIFGFRQVLRLRRPLGLYAFMYAALHFAVFVAWDYGFDFDLLGPAIFDQRFVLVGIGAFLLLLALAFTSTRRWQQRLGKTWKRLHRLTYLAATLVIVHFMWAVKDAREPLRYGMVVALLLAFRIPWLKRLLRKIRHKLKIGMRLSPKNVSLGK